MIPGHIDANDSGVLEELCSFLIMSAHHAVQQTLGTSLPRPPLTPSFDLSFQVMMSTVTPSAAFLLSSSPTVSPWLPPSSLMSLGVPSWEVPTEEEELEEEVEHLVEVYTDHPVT